MWQGVEASCQETHEEAEKWALQAWFNLQMSAVPTHEGP